MLMYVCMHVCMYVCMYVLCMYVCIYVCRYLRTYVCGSFQKFYTLYVFSLKMNLFYKIHLQVFNVISIVLYYGRPAFGQFLYSCQDAFIFDESDYSGHLLDTSSMIPKRFPRRGLFNSGNKSKSGGLMSGLYGG